MVFRIQGKQLFFTWPQNDCSTQTCVDTLRERFKDFNVLWVEAVRENHQDGTPHIHALVLCGEKVRLSGNSLLELNGKHGHYKAARNPKYLHETYFQKDPVEISSFGDWPYKGATKNLGDEIAQALLSGKTAKELCETHPGYVMSHLQKILLFQALICPQREQGLTKVNLTMGPSSVKLARWLGMNLHTKRRIRANQLYVHSEPGMGKTTTFGLLEREISIFRPVRPNGNNVYWDGYSDLETELILFDEWCQQWPVTIMNDLLSGAPTTLKIHGGTIQKRINKPVVLLSNVELERSYNNVPTQVALAFIQRFENLHVTEPLNLFVLN